MRNVFSLEGSMPLSQVIRTTFCRTVTPLLSINFPLIFHITVIRSGKADAVYTRPSALSCLWQPLPHSQKRIFSFQNSHTEPSLNFEVIFTWILSHLYLSEWRGFASSVLMLPGIETVFFKPMLWQNIDIQKVRNCV
jgi:hypothetical protein